jgi:hypothetical protein
MGLKLCSVQCLPFQCSISGLVEARTPGPGPTTPTAQALSAEEELWVLNQQFQTVMKKVGHDSELAVGAGCGWGGRRGAGLLRRGVASL